MRRVFFCPLLSLSSRPHRAKKGATHHTRRTLFTKDEESFVFECARVPPRRTPPRVTCTRVCIPRWHDRGGERNYGTAERATSFAHSLFFLVLPQNIARSKFSPPLVFLFPFSDERERKKRAKKPCRSLCLYSLSLTRRPPLLPPPAARHHEHYSSTTSSAPAAG